MEHEIEQLRAAFWSDRDPEGLAFAPLADAYRESGDLPRALDIVQEGLARHPDFSSGHIVAGRIHMAKGSSVEAEASFRRVLELDPENTLALKAMGDLATGRGGHAEAAEYFKRLSTLSPDVEPPGAPEPSSADPIAIAESGPEETSEQLAAVDLGDVDLGNVDLGDVDLGDGGLADDGLGGADLGVELDGAPLEGESEFALEDLDISDPASLLSASPSGEETSLIEDEGVPLLEEELSSPEGEVSLSEDEGAPAEGVAAGWDAEEAAGEIEGLAEALESFEVEGTTLDTEPVDSFELEAVSFDADPVDALEVEAVEVEAVSAEPDPNDVWEPQASGPSSLEPATEASDEGDSDDEFVFEVTDLNVGDWNSPEPDLAGAEAAGLDPLDLAVSDDDQEVVQFGDGDAATEEPTQDSWVVVDDVDVEPVGEFLVQEALDAAEDEDAADEEEVEASDGDEVSAETDEPASAEDRRRVAALEEELSSAMEAFQALLDYEPKPRAEPAPEEFVPAPTDPDDFQPRDWTWTPLSGDVGAEDEAPVVSVESLAPDPVDIASLAPDEAESVDVASLAPDTSNGEAIASTVADSGDSSDSAPATGDGEGDAPSVSPNDFQAWLDRNKP